MGAVSTTVVTILEQLVFGNKRIHLVRFACSVYGTDGLSITPALCGLAILDYAIPFFVGTGAVAAGPVCAWWDKTNSLIILLQATNSGVTADTVINTAGTVYVIAIGS